MPKFLAPSWAQIYAGLANVASKIISDKAEFDSIVGLARGGWIPARILSDFLGIRRLVSLQVYSYEDFERGGLKGLDTYAADLGGRRVLLVDDVADTGSSLLYAKKLVEEKGIECKTAAIYVKPWTKLRPDYFFEEVKEWVVFPWEIFETLSTLLSQGSADYEAAIEEIGIEKQLYEAVKPVLGALHGSSNRAKKI